MTNELQWRLEATNILNQAFSKDELSSNECNAYIAGYIAAKQEDKQEDKEEDKKA